MPSVTVNSRGIELYYEDSGLPTGSTSYSTVVLIHGYYLHSCTSSAVNDGSNMNRLSLTFVSHLLSDVPAHVQLRQIEQPSIHRSQHA